MRNLLDRYSDEDIPEVSTNVRDGADALCDLLIQAAKAHGYGNHSNGHIKAVPYEHVSGRENGFALAVIYEEVGDLAEQIQLGYEHVMEEHEALMGIQREHGVFFEMYNGWSCGVYLD